MRAADNDRADCAVAFLKAGAVIDLPDAKGRTALWHAVRSSSLGVCKVLIEAGTDVDREDAKHVTPRMKAQKSQNASIVQLFADRTR